LGDFSDRVKLMVEMVDELILYKIEIHAADVEGKHWDQMG